MKIGCIKNGINIHGKITNKLTAYLRLDEDLEDEFEKAEGTTHYSFNHTKAALREVRDIIKRELEEFQKQLGFKTENTEKKLKNELNNALTELNEMASDLGLPTEFATGKREETIFLTIKSLTLPNDGTNRVDIGQRIGPIEYQISNTSGSPVVGQLVVYFEQSDSIKKQIFLKPEVIVDSSSYEVVQVEEQIIEADDFVDNSMVLIKAIFYKKDSDIVHAQVSRSVWLGIDPPFTSNYLCDIKLSKLILPRADTKRVELGEFIRHEGFTISNNQNMDLKLNIDVKIRKSKSSDSNVIDLVTLLEEREFKIRALSDSQFHLDEVLISSDIFGNVFDEATTAKNRKCEIFISVRFSQNYEELRALKGERACHKKTQEFFCGVDPAGQSIFKEVKNIDAKDDFRRAYTSGSSTEGYTFILNIAHPSFKWVQEHDSDIRESYYQEQMIFHACKLAIKDEIFDGPLANYKERFIESGLSQHELVENFDEIIGMMFANIRA